MSKVTKSEWVELVIDLRTARSCGTFGDAPPLDHNDPERNRIHDAQKQATTAKYAGWISAGDTCKEIQ